jgi:dTDP-4-amino-4,6-dideoxygalactose transaminase
MNPNPRPSLGNPEQAPPQAAGTPVYVTKPSLPPLEEFMPYLQDIWDRAWLTNCGPFHQRLEQELESHLGVEHVSLLTNGTIALVAAIRALKLSGEVITTPFSFVATSHSLLWNGITPVFADIDPCMLNLDPARIEAAITPQTTAIMPVHCYGHACDTAAIAAIASKHGLKVIYDAAHAFGVRDEGGSILRHGDQSVLSFHATKVFNTFEGGAIVSPDAATKAYVDELRNFGIVGETTVVSAGINGKMSEFNAALGLLQLQHVDEDIAARERVNAAYCERLAGVEAIRCLNSPHEPGGNYSYFPILVGDAYPLTADGLSQRLKDHGIYPRRYFHPLISEFPMYRDLPSAAASNLPVATDAAKRVLCLPIYPELDAAVLDLITSLIANP